MNRNVSIRPVIDYADSVSVTRKFWLRGQGVRVVNNCLDTDKNIFLFSRIKKEHETKNKFEHSAKILEKPFYPVYKDAQKVWFENLVTLPVKENPTRSYLSE